MKPFQIIIEVLIAILVPVVLATLFWWNRHHADPMVILTVALPYAVAYLTGVATLYTASPEKAHSTVYRIFKPWLPYGIFITAMLFFVDGWDYWGLYAVLMLPAASMGGLVTGYFRTNAARAKA